jgi:hypothetical protein
MASLRRLIWPALGALAIISAVSGYKFHSDGSFGPNAQDRTQAATPNASRAETDRALYNKNYGNVPLTADEQQQVRTMFKREYDAMSADSDRAQLAQQITAALGDVATRKSGGDISDDLKEKDAKATQMRQDYVEKYGDYPEVDVTATIAWPQIDKILKIQAAQEAQNAQYAAARQAQSASTPAAASADTVTGDDGANARPDDYAPSDEEKAAEKNAQK